MEKVQVSVIMSLRADMEGQVSVIMSLEADGEGASVSHNESES